MATTMTRPAAPATTGTGGRLLGIARHDRPRGPMETVTRVAVGLATGIAGDFRGALKPGRNKRQVTLLLAEDWRAAMRELDLAIEWQHRRVNLLVDGADLPRVAGTLVRIGPVLLEITGECEPCSRMEEVAPGLKAALLPGWRGGRTARVLAEGVIAVGDAVTIEERE